MLSSFPFLVAYRNFSAKKDEWLVSFISAFSLLGVVLGVAALIIVMAVMNGFRIKFTQTIKGLNSDLVITQYQEQYMKYTTEVRNRLAGHSFIKHVNPLIEGEALATNRSRVTGAIIRGIDLKDLKMKPEIIDNVLLGDMIEFQGNDVVALGQRMAEKLGARVGAVITLTSSNSVPTIMGAVPRNKNFRVVAIFSSGIYDYDEATILMPFEAASIFFNSYQRPTVLEVYLADGINDRLAAEDIYTLLGRGTFKVQSWQDRHGPFLEAIDIERMVMFAILSLIILVAAFNIISSLFMLVKDKTKEIAILRTIGASRRDIMIIFMLHGSFIGFLGTGMGVILGTAIAMHIQQIKQFLEDISYRTIFDPAIYFLNKLPCKIVASDVIMISVMSLLLCLLATIYPAYRAATLDPVEALRHE